MKKKELIKQAKETLSKEHFDLWLENYISLKIIDTNRFIYSFNWSDSNEGHGVWHNITWKLNEGTYQKEPAEEPKRKTWKDLGIEEYGINWFDKLIGFPKTMRFKVNKFIALQKLIDLRDDVNGGWKPDWSDEEIPKHIINVYKDDVDSDSYYSKGRRVMCFKDDDISRKFLLDHKDLLETAKELL